MVEKPWYKLYTLCTGEISVLSNTSARMDRGMVCTHFYKMQENNRDAQQPDIPLSSSSLVLTTMPPKDSKPGLKWNSRAKAQKILTDGLNNGSIDPNQKPKEVWESNTEFQKYLLPSFRAAFNRKKSDLGINLRAEGNKYLLSVAQWIPLSVLSSFFVQFLFLFVPLS